jgi:hypothetical protein
MITGKATFSPPLAGGVGGGGHESFPYSFHDAINVAENFMIPKSENLKTLAPKPRIPVMVPLFLNSMLPAIHFNHKSHLQTGKIHDIGSQQLLTTKLEPTQHLISQVPPQDLFSFG